MKRALLAVPVLFAFGCADAVIEGTDDDSTVITDTTNSGPKSDDFAPTEAVSLEGPAARCSVAAGDETDPDFRRDTLSCTLAAESGFTVTEVSFGGAESPFQMTLLNGDTSQLSGHGGLEVATFPAINYPVSYSITVGYRTSAIIGHGGKTGELTSKVECDVVLNGPDDAETTCGGHPYELWLVEVLPDEELGAAWRAGEYGAASFSANVFLDSPAADLCFSDGGPCTAAGSVSASWGFNDSNDLDSEVYFLVPSGSPDLLVSLAARVPANSSVQPNTLTGPGSYYLDPSGVLTPAN